MQGYRGFNDVREESVVKRTFTANARNNLALILILCLLLMLAAHHACATGSLDAFEKPRFLN